MSIGRRFLLLKLYYHPFLCNKKLEALLSGLASFPFTKALKPYQSLQQTEPCIHHYSFSYLLISFESSKHHQMKTRSIERVFHLVFFILHVNPRLHRCLKNIDGGSFFAASCGRNKAKNERFESVLSTHRSLDFPRKSGLFLLYI